MAKKLEKIDAIDITPNVSVLATSLLRTYHLSHGLSIADALVAATAIETSFDLLTYNTKDFRFIENLRLFLNS